MREIKFRAWDKEKKVMGIVTDIDFKCKTYWFNWYRSDIRQGHYILLSDEIELMQFTGLKDKNGKEIFEGDIVKNIPSAFAKEEVFGEIVWFPGHCRFAISRTNHYLDMCNTYEIIGNIYENPDLLTLHQ